MSWIPEEPYQYSWWQRFVLRVLRCGTLPRHVAFIMDGNRRYAKQKQVQKVQGHIKGFEKLAETLQWCHDLGIDEVTVYAFSIENFKRDESEVQSLLNIARDKFKRLVDESDRFAEAGLRVNVVGKLSLLPDDLRALVERAVRATASNSRCTLNVALSYTSREEMTSALRKVAVAVGSGALEASDVDEALVQRCLYASRCPDLLIRTSGEVRLSDFLLWQSAYSVTHFSNVLWPDFDLTHLMAAIFHFQSKHYHVAKLLPSPAPEEEEEEQPVNARVAEFLRLLENDRRGGAKLPSDSSCNS